MKLKALASAALLCVAGYSSAATVNIGGLNLDTGSTFAVASIYENVVSGVGDVLSGVGEVTQINGVNIDSLCAGCELTYQFGGYTVTSLSATDISFSGGYINFYLGFGGNNDFNPFGSPGSATDMTAATNGSLFLTLSGHQIDAAMNTFAGTGLNVNTSSPIVFGSGLADVDWTGTANGNTAGVGALANAFFDTNGVPAGFGGPADFVVDSSLTGTARIPHPGECPGGPMCLAGSASISAAIPEPETYALMLAGLGVMGWVARRRRNA